MLVKIFWCIYIENKDRNVLSMSVEKDNVYLQENNKAIIFSKKDRKEEMY